MSTPVPSPDLRQRRNQSQGVAYPVSDDEDEGYVKRNYGVNQFRGLSGTVLSIRNKVEKERREAIAAQEKLKLDLVEQDAASKVVHKELSLQLRVAGRSYDQLLTATRELSEEVRMAEERRLAEVEPLKVEIKELKRKLTVIENPWKEKVKERDGNILKLQETIAPLEQALRNEKHKVQPMIDKFKNEIKVREEATEVVVKEMKYWQDHVEEIKKEAADALKAEQIRAQSVIEPLRAEVEEQRRECSTVVEPYKKEIRELKHTIELLQYDLNQVDYEPYKRQIAINEVQYKNLVRDFEIKDTYNRNNLETMRLGYEQLAKRMDKKLQDLTMERDLTVKPYKDSLELKDIEIANLVDKMSKIKERAEEERSNFLKTKAEMEVELKIAYEAMDFGQAELVRVQEGEKQRQKEQMDNDPQKALRKVEAKLEEVTLRCQTLIKIKDKEMEEKIECIQRLQATLKEKAQLLHEVDREWNLRVVKKEEGFQILVGELAYAEGQIQEERRTVAAKLQEIRNREREINALKEAHTEELRCRQLDRDELAQKLRRVEAELVDQNSGLQEQICQLEQESLMWQLRAQADSTDLLIDVRRKEEARTLIEDKIQALTNEYYNARMSWEEKEREMDSYIRSRDRHIIQLKNEIEAVNDSWEIKYSNLVFLYEKLQKRYAEVVGPNGALEAERRQADLKNEVRLLKEQINDLTEQVKKSKRRCRDLELQIDETIKETADLLHEKDKGIANMVGDYARLRQAYQDVSDQIVAIEAEKDMELKSTMESFQVRVDELEQLVESFRFTDRQQILDRIAGWKKAYERVVIERDVLDEEHAHILEVKESQILSVVKESGELADKFLAERQQQEEEHTAKEKSWRTKEVGYKHEKAALDAEIRRLTSLLAIAEAKAKQMSLMSESTGEDPEKAKLYKDLELKDQQIDAMQKGIELMVAENEELAKKTEDVGVDVGRIHESYKPILVEKDQTIKRMGKEYTEMKQVLEIELYKAQQVCRGIEERVKKFPNPFEVEVREMRDKYAQMQAGMVNLSRENMYQRDALDTLKTAREKEVNHLEMQLKMAVQILKDVAGLGVLQSMSGLRLKEVEEALGIDLDGDGRIS